MKKFFALAVICAAACSPAVAGDWYAGVDVGSVKINDVWTKTGYGFHVGTNLSPNVAIEGGYRSLGSGVISTPYNGYVFGVDLKASALQLSALFKAPINNTFGYYGRIGFNQLRAEASYSGASATDTSTKLLWGVGLDATLSDQINMRLEYQKPASDTSVLSLGATYKF